MNAYNRLKAHGSQRVRLGGKLWCQVRNEYAAALRMSADGVRQIGAKTRHERATNIRSFIFQLATQYPLHCLSHLKDKHIESYCRYMEDRKLKASTIATKLSHIAVLCQVIGKPQLLHDRGKYFRDPACLRRTLAADRDKSIEAVGLVFENLYAKAHDLNPRVACQLALCWHFGLRVQEAWCFRPHLALRDGLVHVHWGTKGGRKRVLPIQLTEEQKHLIYLAQTFAVTEPESMVPRQCSLKTWKSAFYRVTHRIGLTKGQSGATPHSLRHSFLNREYERVTGRLSPIRGGTLAQEDAPSDRAARLHVADNAGHSRSSIASAYIGGVRSSRYRRPPSRTSAHSVTVCDAGHCTEADLPGLPSEET